MSGPTEQRGGNLILASGADHQLQRQGQPASFIERLSSVELLFMISSLMFLVLIALGLAASYLCFRRQTRRRGADKRASAILRGKRHYPTTQALGSIQATPGQGSYLDRMLPANMRPSGRYVTPTYVVAGPGPVSSSPESELSHSGLLGPSSQAYFYGNRAFVGDAGGAKQPAGYLAPIGFSTTPARRETSHYAYGQSAVNGTCRHLVPERAPLPPLPPPPPPIKQRPAASTRSSQYNLAYAASGSKYKAQPEARYMDYQSRAPSGQSESVWRAKAASLRHRAPGSLLGASAATLNRHRPRSYVQEPVWPPEANNNSYCKHDELPRKRAPKLYLKSIEDSYITKLTEIHEQEYMKRDTTRPLGLAEWRKFSLAPKKAASHFDNQSSASSSNTELDDDSGRQQVFNSVGQTNLRSLTELDVNFARSLLRPSGRKSPAASLRTARSLDRLADRDRLSANEPSRPASEVCEARERSSSNPEVGVHPRAPSCSPDLILSPDYDHARLELSGPTPGNTVSYV